MSAKTAAGPARFVAAALPVLTYSKYAALRFSQRLAGRSPRSFSRCTLARPQAVVPVASPQNPQMTGRYEPHCEAT